MDSSAAPKIITRDNQNVNAEKEKQYIAYIRTLNYRKKFQLYFILIIFANMRILSWNVQGFKTASTRNHLSGIIRAQNPDIIFLCETKLSKIKCQPFLKQYQYPNWDYIEPEGMSGGLVILWKNGFTCDIVDTHLNMFSAIVQSDPSKPEFLLTCIYCFSNYTKKKDQWSYIKQISENNSNPWVVLGDLNFHLDDNETDASSSSDGLVNNIVASSGLEDIGFIGKNFTWSNNNMGTGTIKSRIDMALGNGNWNLYFPNSRLHHLTQIVSRLSYTRRELSLWNKEHFGNINQKVENLQLELKQLHELPQTTCTESNIIKVSNELNKWHKIKSEFYQQKARDHFIKDMDSNSKYFHTKVNKRRTRNNIDAIQDHNNIWLQSREDIAQHLTHHYKSINTSSNPVIDVNFYKNIPSIISVEENESLIRIPSNEEIFATLKSMENWSSPGPEGFQAGFYKSQWATVGDDVCNMVKRFFKTRHILKQINETYISLVPKKKKCTCAADYRPIVLRNTSYNIISKVLVNRMKPIMEKLISPYQAAYVSGRLIRDNTVIAQEIIHSMKKKRGENGWLALKLDMSKEFDSTTQLSVMLNGSPCDSFTPTRGIRQGDPLSPYLFILAMEFLSRQLTTSQQDNKIKGIKVVALSPAIDHLLFADDCLIFTQANVTSVNNLLELLHTFSSQSGQVINFEKSSVYFSKKTKPEVAESIKQILRVKSIGTMIKHVLNDVPIYQMGTFKLPANLLQQLTTIERKFFWGYHNNRGHNPIAWMNVCRPTEMGGLAFRYLEKLNLALLTKLSWRICNEPNSLMAQTLSSKYFKSGYLLHQHISVDNCSYTWNGISKGLEIVRQNYFLEINNGKKTRIWRDRWIPGMSQSPTPQNDFFRFYEFVEELMVQETAQWNIHLITALFDADIALKIQALYIDISKEDSIIWMPAKDGVFSVKITYKMLTYNDKEVQIEGRTIDRKVWKSLWKYKDAQRIKLFAWKCIRGVHNTKIRREIYNSSTETSYDICGGYEETIEHIIFDCRHARSVWRGININIDAVRANYNTVSEWVTSWFSTSNQNRDDKWIYSLMIGAWIIWKDRCDVVFQGVSLNPINSIHRIHYHLASHLHETHNAASLYSNVSKWKPPLETIVKFNIDGSYDADTNQYGIGIVLRDSTGEFLGMKRTYGSGALNPEVFECAGAVGG
ncbi:uncharacterized protein LOC113279176 [Papaver somniferum]|uniref:uncharacterized protein LOC113279176 n=1 Tax=Papaver somniferum TaxID=3469 RepID=UPI000E6F9D15|nr:uncharacterized protein LOC113279176 [Papaver somniferum]